MKFLLWMVLAVLGVTAVAEIRQHVLAKDSIRAARLALGVSNEHRAISEARSAAQCVTLFGAPSDEGYRILFELADRAHQRGDGATESSALSAVLLASRTSISILDRSKPYRDRAATVLAEREPREKVDRIRSLLMRTPKPNPWRESVLALGLGLYAFAIFAFVQKKESVKVALTCVLGTIATMVGMYLHTST